MTPLATLRPAHAGLAVIPSHYAPDEFVPLLECSYGAYVYAANPTSVGMPQNSPACHNPVERPEDRHYCEFCGGDYCSVHAARADHECEQVMKDRGAK